ncbi:MAG: hypothetical protein U1F36_10380 [Planctomycetota bacterium]
MIQRDITTTGVGRPAHRRTRPGAGSPALEFVIVATIAVGWIGFCYACCGLLTVALLDGLSIPLEAMRGEPISGVGVAIALFGFVGATLAAFAGTRILARLVRGEPERRARAGRNSRR